ncbi:MAG: hypothetical protein KBD56_05265 [Candidatus Eisenbacteria bacterium]|nr:hypothetical protein [Candidatus Eisenbacteria bacterium]
MDSLRVEGIDRPGVRRATATAHVRLPADIVWEVIIGEKRSEKWPSVEESVQEYARGDTVITRYRIGVPVFKDRKYRMRFVRDRRAGMLRFELVPGYGNVDEARGFWKVIPLGESLTRIVYQLDTDPGMSYIPGFLVSWATKRQIPRIFGHIYEEGSRFLEAGKDAR